MNYTRGAVRVRSLVRDGFGSLDTAADADAVSAAAVGRVEGIDSLIAQGLSSAPARPTRCTRTQLNLSICFRRLENSNLGTLVGW